MFAGLRQECCLFVLLFVLSLFFLAFCSFYFFYDKKTTSIVEIERLERQENHSFLTLIKNILRSGELETEQIQKFKEYFKQTPFPQKFYGCALVIYVPGQKRQLIIRVGGHGVDNVISALKAAVKNGRTTKTDIVRIQLDFIIEKPKIIDNNMLSTDRRSNHFELGIDGLLARNDKKQAYFLPGDAFVKSYFSLKEILSFLERSIGKESWPIAQLYRFKTESFISYEDRWIALYRGYPKLGALTVEDLTRTINLAMTHVKIYQKDNGQFFYYYNAAKDSLVDHEHPKRDLVKNPYYNELRHVGGALLLMFDYQQFGHADSLTHARKALDFMVNKLLKIYDLPDGAKGEYMFFNRKAKLGGSGLALYALSYYQHLTGDASYQEHADRLARHLASQITDSGEFIYYYIYLDQVVSQTENKSRFNFYYPGEALIGLAAYYNNIVHDPKFKVLLKDKIRKSLDFLIHERPKYYKSYFTTLPSDSWLMMAINELWDSPELHDSSYKNFVYEEARIMKSLMYTEKDAFYPDYVGSFYYQYGNFPFADGARCEGFLAAYELAIKAGDKEEASAFLPALKMAAWATLHLVNTPESVYSVPNPSKAIGGIRFKHTRQWFRIDTIQHVAAFYLKFLKYIK